MHHVICAAPAPGPDSPTARRPAPAAPAAAVLVCDSRAASFPAPSAAVEYGIIDRVLEPEEEEVKRVVRMQQPA